MRTSRRSTLLATAALGAGLAILAAGPASAGDTTTTFTLTAGGLSISNPASKNLSGNTAIGTAALSAQLGTVTVTDNRGGLGLTWTAAASATDFTTGGETANETISNANVTYAASAGTSTGVGVDAPELVAQDLSQQRDVFVRTAIIGVGTTSWDPTIEVTVPAAAVAGTYTGTITHSVA